MKLGAPNPQTLSVALFLGLASAAGAYLGLTALGQPENFRVRTANLTDQVAEIQRLSRPSSAARDYRPGALCPTADAEAFAALTSDLQSRASGLGLTIVSMAVAPAAARQGSIERVDLQFELGGAYGAVTTFLTALSTQAPRIFVDRVDLADRTSKVSLRFAGHFYCSTAT